MQPTAIPPTNADSHWRSRLDAFLSMRIVQHTLLALIIVNGLILGIETSAAVMQRMGTWLTIADRLILTVFVLEIAARLLVQGQAFFRSGWNLFDFLVVGIALIPASGPFAVLRALRVLRVLRILTLIPSMRRVVGALLSSIPGMASIGLVLILIYYVFAVIATHLFAADFPDWFGSIGKSFYTLFQIMTLESWSMGISRPVMEQFPYAWAFFVPFILIATFTMLNLFIAIIVNAMQSYSEGTHQETVDAIDRNRVDIESEMHREMLSLRADMAELKELLRQRRTS